ncbi:ATP phosphoribosyltransferase regulatory subunit [Granulibacter bethesdensis]|uniref:ATP phosphoribosyltransferase regulatory subunit n=1 Tax=Granulibacter bethesdensis (strain ATCC BAA-1260 / CGDNIH1) TaxID=391165 RepID=Q0BTV8_GRABC|nr:ATP phosphoribosyltransferase regulatory subunit [Granulibacter bethesdensis]ABI61744.1 ATP phosphoribosyltransferase regulatory subunit [Granulibacter bethesdensis CGDNIH1]APH51553.1 ATP phosphoribosyltransferase regulatory subunit [Granulibacter bethesdensis]APH64246.1 ATP phosphoribosyltransferase regulatory subunit [Granulibacter bethesdensis]
MSDITSNKALLPSGLRDLLPPEAEAEAVCVATLMGVFSAHGYRRVKPPLIEFEETLFAGAGGAVSDQSFRLMDPDSHRMMAVRPDITPQIARIATTRLAEAARPLRLCYAGECVRVSPGSLSADRQVSQAGIELIGVDTPSADAELILVAREALAAAGLTQVSFDLTLPSLVPVLLGQAGREEGSLKPLLHALDRKDAAEVKKQADRIVGPAIADILGDLLLSAGPADGALAALQRAALPDEAQALAERLAATVGEIQASAPDLRLTVDPVEFRGFRYHTGICMTVYAPGGGAPGVGQELGGGGRYMCQGEAGPESASGLTLYPEAILRAVASKHRPVRVYVPVGANADRAAALRRQGFVTVAALDGVAGAHASDHFVAARQQGCVHVLADSALVAVPDALGS